MHIKVPWIGVIAVGIGFLISLVLNIRHWVEFMKTNGSLVGGVGLGIVLGLPAASYPIMHMTQDGVKVVHCMSLFTVGASHAIVYAHCIQAFGSISPCTTLPQARARVYCIYF